MSCMWKRAEVLNSANKRLDTMLLRSVFDSKSSFRSGALDLPQRREKETNGDVFQKLLTDANRELACLLRDVGAASGGSSNETRVRPTGELLMRAVRCATKQFMLQAELGNLALTDELTGLYNRRGFVALAERQLKLARRSRREMMLFFIDVDGLKRINDSFGHSEGDRALKCAAEALEKTFRDSDVISRLGGDEFAVLAVEASGRGEVRVRARLSEYLGATDAEDKAYKISLSLGGARFDPRGSASLGELMTQADQAMYEQKRSRLAPLVTSGTDNG